MTVRWVTYGREKEIWYAGLGPTTYLPGRRAMFIDSTRAFTPQTKGVVACLVHEGYLNSSLSLVPSS